MGLNSTPSANRLHIGFFGKMNVGKSSVVNAVTGQDLAVVSSTMGTTTDPVQKAMELLPLGPVVIIDTPGFDDSGHLGQLRVKKTKQILNRADIAVLVAEAGVPLSKSELELVIIFKEKNIPYVIAYNKSDLLDSKEPEKENEIYISALTGENITALKEKIGMAVKTEIGRQKIVGDLLSPEDIVVLVTPIDESAPKGRLILPQQQTIRDILDSDAAAIVVKETQLECALNSLGRKPAMVITDSQVFSKVASITPQDIPLTSFSILMARYKGFLETAVKGVAALEKLNDGDVILISEGCTHHRQCNDIGTVKIPRWIKNHTGKDIVFKFSSGQSFPEDLSGYSLVIHCGGCMLTEREVKYRMGCAVDQGIPFTNYGIAIAHTQGILKRSISIFPDLVKELEK